MVSCNPSLNLTVFNQLHPLFFPKFQLVVPYIASLICENACNGLKDLHFFNEETEKLQKEAEAREKRNLLRELPNIEAIYNTEQVQFCHLNSRSKQMRLAKQRLYLADA